MYKMYKGFLAPRFGVALGVLFSTIVIAGAGCGVAFAQQANQNWLSYPGAASASAEITEDVTQCSKSVPVQASCEFNKFPGDAYDIHATLDKVPDVSRWFEALTNGKATLSIATATTCAQIDSNGVPTGAFSVTIPPATVTKELFGERAFAQGTIPFIQPELDNVYQSPELANVNFELSTSVFQNEAAALHVSGNAFLCLASSLAVLLTNTDTTAPPGSNTLCVDVPAPVISQLNINGTVVIACAISAG